MLQNLKKLFFSILLLSFLIITGCTDSYNRPYNYNSSYYENNTPPPPQEKKIYKSRYSPKKIVIFHQKRIQGESTFEKILRQSKFKSLKSKKIKHNDCREKFPSNVPRGSI